MLWLHPLALSGRVRALCNPVIRPNSPINKIYFLVSCVGSVPGAMRFELELDLCEPEPEVWFEVRESGWTEPQVQFAVLQDFARTGPNWTLPTLPIPRYNRVGLEKPAQSHIHASKELQVTRSSSRAALHRGRPQQRLIRLSSDWIALNGELATHMHHYLIMRGGVGTMAKKTKEVEDYGKGLPLLAQLNVLLRTSDRWTVGSLIGTRLLYIAISSKQLHETDGAQLLHCVVIRYTLRRLKISLFITIACH